MPDAPVSIRRSLLLNASYEPMRVLSWQKAIILWFSGKVEVVEFHNLFISSVSHRFQLPSVIRLKTYIKPGNHGHVRFCRENIFLRDNHTCQYCGERYSPKHLTLDHVVPASHRGPKTWTNVVTACRDCNQKKADRTPQTANMPLLKEPKMPNWLPAYDFVQLRHSVPDNWAQYLPIQVG